jgi:hypothetical protein
MSMCSNCSVFNSSWGANKGIACKCDAYDIKRIKQETGCAQTPEPLGKIQNLQVLVQTPEPPDSGSNQSQQTTQARYTPTK